MKLRVLGRPVVVVSRAGAGGVTAADFAAKSAPDSLIVLMA